MKTKIIISSLILASLSLFANQTAVNQAPAPQPIAPYPAQPYPMPSHYGLPQNINDQIQKLYPGSFVVDIDLEAYGYEIKLNNRMELYFDMNGRFLGQKFDD
ncbi:hypothetical protein DMB92_07680 [Campylobacter sp. MIT 99-7217]|uniref:PepSY-like domain-containing protein n=1 Tax=Campylobacter sp. MIT 99-7217 TaxID=535091 RepID=UPI00115764CC|nr:PepSY-like domain-containing protein [Campylobacter sp. MIT 99-7217]TQR30332.1 hypothetical protein DMB92_07680 [Campylobacter sp. MIT 99-7217]